jgi:hypothetical protein
MQQTSVKRVEFTQDNVMKCQCGNCPVQEDSSCAADMMQQFKAKTEGAPSGVQGSLEGIAQPSDLPGLYCSSGTAECGDLDFAQSCVCPTCDVWKGHDLTKQHYCEQGDAMTIG